MSDWDHTEIEKDLIREFGGEPTESFGPDGTLGGDPVEVRLAREEDRFRVNKDTHQELVDEGGSYLFDKLGDGVPAREVSAATVDDRLDEIEPGKPTATVGAEVSVRPLRSRQEWRCPIQGVQALSCILTVRTLSDAGCGIRHRRDFFAHTTK